MKTIPLTNPTIDAIANTWQNARSHLWSERNALGHWEGELSSSALSTATAICALRDYQSASEKPCSSVQQLCDRGLRWLAEHQNDDGGWGDTVASFSNISTTALCWAALAKTGPAYRATTGRCEQWLTRRADSLDPVPLARAIRARYGQDHTFSVPILTTLALAGRLGPEPAAWSHVPQLPFELAACPHSWFAALRLPVVSYALPALIAIGLVRHRRAPTRNLPLRGVRAVVAERTLRRLQQMQPESGGFLEATPLTSFVMMSLVGAGLVHHPVVERCLRFLVESIRDDGSWPIDTNIATWVTTMSVRALHENAPTKPAIATEDAVKLRSWIVSQQHCVEHPYTKATPGGWAWTNLSGGVPDADDTPSALLSLKCLDDGSEALRSAVSAGVEWLLDIQNRDGGIPTFCRGWGMLPFDRSSADLTAHALRAWRAWHGQQSAPLQRRLTRARKRALRFLLSQQDEFGAWKPLWFGNQHTTDETNSTYGTSRVLLALIEELPRADHPIKRAVEAGSEYLLQVQNQDGGWGGGADCPSSIEETALAMEALVSLASARASAADRESIEHARPDGLYTAILQGTRYLVDRTQSGRCFPPSPIGFYFAKLWYFESLYPVIFTVNALGKAACYLSQQQGGMCQDEVAQ